MLAKEVDAYVAVEDLRAAADRVVDCMFVLRPGLPHASLDPDVRSETNRQTGDRGQVVAVLTWGGRHASDQVLV